MTISSSVDQTLSLGESVGQTLRGGEILALAGDLGTGKTHFVKGLARGLGIKDSVSSPTFTLIHEYRGGRLPLNHFDFYRLNSETEALAIGLDEYLDGDAVTAIEWGDKFQNLLPASTRWIRFHHLEEGKRGIEF
jgi:tRNA threonylcarbamoyladenosine biosynthesis protein TsaE